MTKWFKSKQESDNFDLPQSVYQEQKQPLPGALFPCTRCGMETAFGSLCPPCVWADEDKHRNALKRKQRN